MRLQGQSLKHGYIDPLGYDLFCLTRLRGMRPSRLVGFIPLVYAVRAGNWLSETISKRQARDALQKSQQAKCPEEHVDTSRQALDQQPELLM